MLGCKRLMQYCHFCNKPLSVFPFLHFLKKENLHYSSSVVIHLDPLPNLHVFEQFLRIFHLAKKCRLYEVFTTSGQHFKGEKLITKFPFVFFLLIEHHSLMRSCLEALEIKVVGEGAFCSFHSIIL